MRIFKGFARVVLGWVGEGRRSSVLVGLGYGLVLVLWCSAFAVLMCVMLDMVVDSIVKFCYGHV